MAKKTNRRDYEKAKEAASYYELKTRAVDELVNTNVTNVKPVSEAELHKYRSRSRFAIPMWGKVILIKWWLAAIVCWFFIFGLAIADALDQLVVAGIGLGVVTDLVTNNLIRWMASPQGANEKWLMVPKRRFISLPLNIVYALVLCGLTYRTYTAVNTLAARWTADPDNPLLPVGPIGFGLIVLGWDLVLNGFRRGILGIVRDARQNAGR